MKRIPRLFMAFISRVLNLQCSGKQICGYENTLEHCKYRAFHDGVCESYQNQPFRNPRYSAKGSSCCDSLPAMCTAGIGQN